ncbi:hypothetical protein [Micromonospora gifhornensis]|uniref:hypothetical protein n=1 Tax=Micromonospora gifhornensis TaxID=84594 RepID=UPI003669B715
MTGTLAGALRFSDARLLNLTNNAVFALPEAGLVIQITRSHRLQERAAKVARLARWFERLDAPRSDSPGQPSNRSWSTASAPPSGNSFQPRRHR